MIADREQIYTALLALLQEATGITSVSRVVRDIADLAPEDYPIIMQEEVMEKAHNAFIGVPPTYQLSVDVGLYIQTGEGREAVGQETVVPAKTLNNLIKTVEAALAPSPVTQVQDLGGLVEHLYIEGEIKKYLAVPGRGNGVSVAIIPILILAL